MAPLKAHRLKKALSQRDLAALSGVEQATIARIEKRRGPGAPPRKLHLRTVRNLATALEVDPAMVDEFRPSMGLEEETLPGQP